MIRTASAHQNIETGIDARLPLAAMLFADRRQRSLKRLAQGSTIRFDLGSRDVEGRFQMRRNRGAHGQRIQRCLVGLRGVARIAHLLEIISLLQQRRQMPRFQGERLLDGVELLETPAECL